MVKKVKKGCLIDKGENKREIIVIRTPTMKPLITPPLMNPKRIVDG
tara:strand:+ start:363 stop:500 length:138 start_codon:yes stop_codon:yes gene_type:complete